MLDQDFDYTTILEPDKQDRLKWWRGLSRKQQLAEMNEGKYTAVDSPVGNGGKAAAVSYAARHAHLRRENHESDESWILACGKEWQVKHVRKRVMRAGIGDRWTFSEIRKLLRSNGIEPKEAR